MITGLFRDAFPRVTLQLPGLDGEFSLEFIVDTGFDGHMSLPPAISFRLYNGPVESALARLADGSWRECGRFEIMFALESAARPTEVVVMPGNPLIGTRILNGSALRVNLWQDGEVEIDLPD